MKKNGFTMVELIAIVVIMASMLLIILPAVNSTIKNSEEKKKQEALNNIYMAAENYLMANYDDYKTLDNVGASSYIYITDLISNDYMSIDTLNPNNDSSFSNKDAVKVTRNDDGTFSYNLDLAKTLYDVIIEKYPFLNTDGDGCITSDSNNYSYMGGCYLKGNSISRKEEFINTLLATGAFSSADIIEQRFFDESGNFKATEFENWGFNDMGVSKDDLQQMGYNSIFEYLFYTSPEEYFLAKEIKNNYVWYSGFLWQIMGINKDKTIKLIAYDNVGVMIFDNKSSNYENSYVSQWLNEYFLSKINYTDNIVPKQWCVSENQNITNFRSSCDNLTSEIMVGLLTLDEYGLAGGQGSYLNKNQSQFTMTPYGDNIYTILSYSNGNLNVTYNDYSSINSIYPIINVKSNIIVTSGNGTFSNNETERDPFVLIEDKKINVTGNLNERSTVGEYVTFSDKLYRIIDYDVVNGNKYTKIVLDGYYEVNNEVSQIVFGNENVINSQSGVGLALNNEILNWIVPTSTEKEKIYIDYVWNQKNFSYQDYHSYMNDKNNQVNLSIGMQQFGDILNGQSNYILTKKYTTASNYMNSFAFWLMNQFSTNSTVVDSSGIAVKISQTKKMAVRPVIVIKSNVKIKSGNGTFSNPYQI